MIFVEIFYFFVMKEKYNFWYRNGLTIAFILMTILSIAGQWYNGWKEYNEFLQQHGQFPVRGAEYIKSGHFLQATFENWESEFLQMFLFVILTIFLRQKGSSESKSCDEPAVDPSQLKPLKDSPWPVKKGGVWLSLYKHSLSISLFILFLMSWAFHYYGSWMDYNEQQLLEGKSPINISDYLGTSKFWFESFQNWQSEFLSIFAIIFLSIYLRQIGSSQSKPVNAPHSETGE
jgi:hypothetical protein